MAKKPLYQYLRIFLLPLAILYWVGVKIRNWLYDKQIKKTVSFGLPIICVGNLAVGGTGKSPMVEYLVRLLKKDRQIATLSRGYKRRTKGYAIANENTTALDIGDEPMQFHLKFPDIAVVVGEKRIEAIPQILHDRPKTQVVVLDDAFQHRAIKAGLNILLTDYNNLFTRDFYMPTGELRDDRASYKRAEIIVVTKSDSSMPVSLKERIIKEIKPLPHQQVFFTTTLYGTPYHIHTREQKIITNDLQVLLLTGIARTQTLVQLLKKHTKYCELMAFPDHHIFTITDLKAVQQKFEAIKGNNKIIVTTEKDAVRLHKFGNEIADWLIYVLPIEHRFLFDEKEKFDKLVTDFVTNFKVEKRDLA